MLTTCCLTIKALRDIYIDAYLFESSGCPDSRFRRPYETAAIPLHQCWHRACSDADDRRKPCQVKHVPSWPVEPSLFKECDIGLAYAAICGWHELFIWQTSPTGAHHHNTPTETDTDNIRDPYNVCPRRPGDPSTTSFLRLPLSLFNLRLKARDWGAYLNAHITPTDTICNPYTVFPRRLWDLSTNRVVPSWLCYQNTLEGGVNTAEGTVPPKFAAISHSWRPPSELVYVETPINAFAWPVPLPVGLDLEDLRKQIQKHTQTYDLRYVWLDVLCLRQVHNVPAAATRIFPDDQAAWDRGHLTTDGNSWISALSLGRDSDGSLRSSELAIDVPTIGNVYRLATKVLRYFNGLGQPLSLTGWDLPTHWLNRAWTLQEHVPQSIDLGIKHIRGNYLNLEVAKRGHTCLVREHLQAIYGVVGSPTLLGLVAEMGRRFAANEVDKVAGLSYALQLPELPTYARTAGVEAAWRRCMAVLPPRWIAELFFNCPLVASVHVNEDDDDDAGGCQWTPTWGALAGLPPSFVPYAIIPKDGDAGSAVLHASSSRLGSMRANVACIFPSRIAHVQGTKIDYLVQTLDGRMREARMFVAHNGLLPEAILDLIAAAAGMTLEKRPRLVMARPLFKGAIRPHGWVETWVLLLVVRSQNQFNWWHWVHGSEFRYRLWGPWVCKKLGVFRSDAEVPEDMEIHAVVEAHVDGEICLTNRGEDSKRLHHSDTSSEADTYSEAEHSEGLEDSGGSQADMEVEHSEGLEDSGGSQADDMEVEVDPEDLEVALMRQWLLEYRARALSVDHDWLTESLP